MREILFRGKRIDNGDWIEGYYVKTVDYRTDSAVHLIIELPSAFYPRGEIAEEYEINSSTIGQYTGLTDKNGRKIFEGDIVAISPNMSRKRTLGVVKFGDYKTPPYGVDKTNRGFYIRWYYENEAIEEMLRRDIVFWFNYSHVDISIIGNIYDNPELLEVTE